MSTIAHHIRRPAPTSTPERPALTVVSDTGAIDERPADELRTAVSRALETSRAAREHAERALHVAEAARIRAAHALEVDLRPMRIDEQARAALRATFASAAAEVEARRSAYERARALEDATARVCAEIEAHDAAGLGELLVAQSRAAN